jgi:hypothetical protein
VAFLGGLFGSKIDPLEERAQSLVEIAQGNAVTMFTPLLDRFPMLRQVNTEHWDFFLTVAGVFMAATRLNDLGLQGKRKEKIMEIVARNLDQWKSDGTRGFEDCKSLFEHEFDRLTATGHESRFVASDGLGIWIVWNIFGRSPQSDDECALVRVIGIMVTHNFFEFWAAKDE